MRQDDFGTGAGEPSAPVSPEEPAPETAETSSQVPPSPWAGGAPEGPVEPPAGKPKGKLIAAVGVLAAVVVGLVVKFALPVVIGSAIGSAISSAFGGPWEQLPSDVRAGYEQRIKDAAGDRLDGLSKALVGTTVEGWVVAGLPRLDDVKLTRHLELEVQALRQTDEETCAGFSRHAASGTPFPNDVAVKFVSALDEAATIDWVGINVDAIEAELRDSPERTSVPASQSDPVLTAIVDQMSEADLQTLVALSGSETVTDAEACAAVRSLYDFALLLDPAERAVLARYDVQP